MKKLFTFICLLFAVAAFSQQYNNEWIDFSKAYYKFKVGQTGLYRIPKGTLDAAGLGNTPAEQFKLFRNGVEIPIYTTAPAGLLASDGYIEFWGEMNDGKADKPMYRSRPYEPFNSYQHSDKISLQTDTAVYFLTVNTGTNLRITDQLNNVASTVLPMEDFFMYSIGNHFKTKINPGYARNVGEYVYSSSYDQGEYFSSRDITPSTPLSDVINNMFVYSGGPNPYISFGASGNAQSVRSITVMVNGVTAVDRADMNDFDDTVANNLEFSINLINGSTATTNFINNSSVSTDRMVVSFYDITYPRRFNFGGARNFPFTLPAKANGYYLAITNFNNGSALPILYDLTHGKRYTAVPGGGDTLKFALPGAVEGSQLVLVNEDASNITNIASLSSKIFTDFTNTSNQGDYLIISNPILYTGSTGNNPVIDYRDYRRSIPGGSFNATVVNIDELVDQFAFGIKKHPLSIKNFLKYARDNFSVAPKFVFLIGKGVDYSNYRSNQSNPLAELLNLIPTFGSPGSDNKLSAEGLLSSVPVTPIGRLSVIKGKEIEDYLEKVKEYEEVQQTAPYTIQDRLWMKEVLHVTGAGKTELGATLCNYMHGYKGILEDTLSGANVSIFCKSSSNPEEQVSNDRMTKLFENGLSLVTYFGHSSSTTLEFNINDPENYNSQGKYPVFSVNGCNAGNFFTFNPQRLESNEAISEKFVLAKQRGAIAFFASTHFGIVNYLNIYIDRLYKNISTYKYGQTLGEISKASLDELNQISSTDFYVRTHTEQITLHGDPAIKMNFQGIPDYVIEDPQIKISPSFVSIAENSFNVNVKMYNLGKAVNDSIRLEVRRQYPDGSSEVIFTKKIKGVNYSDSLSLDVPIVGTRDKGANKITVTLDADNAVSEANETNNTITKDLFIYEDEARPAFPYNYSIVADPTQKLYASTADPFGSFKNYIIEIDTTENFNSLLKKSQTFNLSGGILEFDPAISFVNGTVYYWRVGVPQVDGDIKWNTSSFKFSSSDSSGFNQSHFYQFTHNNLNGLEYSGSDRETSYTERTSDFTVNAGIYPYTDQVGSFSLDFEGGSQNGFYAPLSANQKCLRFYVIDKRSLIPWKNIVSGSTGLYGSYAPIPFNGSANPGFFQFDISTTAARKIVMDFLDSIPNGNYVAMTNTPADITILPDVWQGDTSTLGSNNSLYHKVKDIGFTNIDQLTSYLPFIFIYQKGNPLIIKQEVASHPSDILSFVFIGRGVGSDGKMTSEVFGPAKKWKSLHIDGSSLEPVSNDTVSVDIVGITAAGAENLLAAIHPPFADTSLEWIDVAQYPSLKLRLNTTDSITYTPFQLNSWKIAADYVPEGVVAPNLFFSTKDTLDIGEKLNFAIAFKNISLAAFDSIKVNASVLDNSNIFHAVPLATKGKPLVNGDTLIFRAEVDTKDYPGNNTLSIDFNPDNDQPEQYHYNNFLFRDFYVKPDKTNPLLDVTFDGVHIINGDIVSSKPHIQIKVKDEAKFMLLNDTSAIQELQIRYPDSSNTLKTYTFDNTTLRFTPAQSGTDNTATIDFFPSFSEINESGDEYQLIIKVKDRSGNSSGITEYKVSFMVISKPMISNLLNYPNPFTTSTAFVFTLTGSELPQNMKIQILTVTGKIVREITKEELGPIHIGRNITEYKWNGTDQYGQRLANGVYLYRVVTTLNGGRMDKYKAKGDDTDKYFNKGYGKMYLMR